MSLDIIDQIDQALSCQHCHRALNYSPSDDFCSESCQRSWHARRVVRQCLIGIPHHFMVVTDEMLVVSHDSSDVIIRAMRDIGQQMQRQLRLIFRPFIDVRVTTDEAEQRIRDVKDRALKLAQRSKTGPSGRHRASKKIDPSQRYRR